MVEEQINGETSRAGFLEENAVSKGSSLANLLLDAPERFANGDQQVVQESLGTMKAILDFALETESAALTAVGKYLAPIWGESSVKQTRGQGGRKRKRNQSNGLLGLTPLDTLTVDKLNEDQIWSQIELKNEKISALLGAAMVESGVEDEQQKMLEEEEAENEEMEVLDEVQKKEKKQRQISLRTGDNEDSDELESMPTEQIVHSLKGLSDAELRSLGLDPNRRAELEKLEEMDDVSLQEDSEDEGMFGYPGTSDLSDDDEMRGKVIVEPLRTEEEQARRQREVAAQERQRLRSQRQLKKMMGIEEEEEDDEEEDADEDDEEDDEDDLDYAAKENEDPNGQLSASEEEEDDSEEEESASHSERRRLSSILDTLDESNSSAPLGKRWKTHPTLDDDFFSIQQFNQDTDDYGDEGVNLGDDVDLFKAVEEEEDPILYNDFFAPPPGAPKLKQATVQRSNAPPSKPATIANGEEEHKRTLVRFHDEVLVRRIKPRKSSEMEITPELLRALQKREVDGDSDEEGEEDGEEELEDSGEESEEEEEEEEEEEMDVDINSQMDDESLEDEEEEGDENATEEESLADDERETAQRVAGDLFADDAEDDEENGTKKRQSGYEKRLEKLQKEIARLEQENVSKKDWTLMGETGSRTRPENSLLAESLDFENNQRAKPIITPETTSTLEDMIRKRILESSFDDVERRANVQAFDFLPSKMLELSDSKSSKSLDQVYEDELGMGTGVSHGEKMDKQLEKDHQEISRLYDELEYKLDALSNAHFTPKVPKATIQTISNTPTITLEESLPSTSTYTSQLAPEEVYDAGRHNAALQGERSEMTPEEKKRLQKQLRSDKKARNDRIDSVKRNVEINKQAFAKNRGSRFVGSGKKGSRNDAIEKQEALTQLMGNKGVTVVGKGNEEKKRRKNTDDSSSLLNASHLKL